MSFKSLLKITKKIVFTSVGISVLSLIKADPAEALVTCPAEGSDAANGTQQSTCIRLLKLWR